MEDSAENRYECCDDGRWSGEIEVQGTAEDEPLYEELLTLLDLAKQGCNQIFIAQRSVRLINTVYRS